MKAALCDATVVGIETYFNDDKVAHGGVILSNLREAGYTVISEAELRRVKQQAHLAYLYLNVETCPRCRLPRAQGLVCPCGNDE